MSIGTSIGTGLAIAGAVGAAGSIASGVIGAHAAGSAADKQAQQDQAALDFQKQTFATTQANQAPFVSAGQSSIKALMDAIQNGTFGPGSIPQFQLPTLAQAEQTPGFQFNLEQGNKGILQGSAAAGGALSGGTLKALANYDTGLASTTYQQQVQNALASYQALLSGQQQQYNQIANVASLGENAAANVGNQGVATGAQVGQTASNLGGALASGVVGQANAISGGIGSISNLAQLYGLLNMGGSTGSTFAQPTNTFSPPGAFGGVGSNAPVIAPPTFGNPAGALPGGYIPPPGTEAPG